MTVKDLKDYVIQKAEKEHTPLQSDEIPTDKYRVHSRFDNFTKPGAAKYLPVVLHNHSDSIRSGDSEAPRKKLHRTSTVRFRRFNSPNRVLDLCSCIKILHAVSQQNCRASSSFSKRTAHPRRGDGRHPGLGEKSKGMTDMFELILDPLIRYNMQR